MLSDRKNRKCLFLIIDSLREEKDYDTLRQFSRDIETVAVVSSSRIRYERMAERRRKGDPLLWEEFLVLEQKEMSKFGKWVKLVLGILFWLLFLYIAYILGLVLLDFLG